MENNFNCFKAYDVRGKLGIELNSNIVYQIGRSVAEVLDAKTVVLGFDARETSPELAIAAAKGVCDAGADILEIGLAGTEEMYWAVSQFKADAGIEITASHNPIDYNGMKFVKSGSAPLSETEFSSIKLKATSNDFRECQKTGSIFDKRKEARSNYVSKLLSFIDVKNLKPLKIVINSGNGAAGPTIDALDDLLTANGFTAKFIRVHHNPDGTFPNGVPNPLLPENWIVTSDAVKNNQADFGVAFDGDFDRCFLFDHHGNFIQGEYLVGLLAEVFLKRKANTKIIHDPRVIWNTRDVVKNFGGTAVLSKTGHAYIKQAMRSSNAVYGGEISAHHYFKDFAFCDSGMIPWLIIWEILSKDSSSLYSLVSKRKELFPSSGEINFKANNALNCLDEVKSLFVSSAVAWDETDGLSMCFDEWRFNLRKSNTEPLLRLNVEVKKDVKLMKRKIQKLKNLITAM